MRSTRFAAAALVPLLVAPSLAAVAAGPALGASEARPVLVMVEANPWLDVIGSDSPTLALYDDGTVLFRRAGADGRSEFARATLDAKARASLLEAAFTADRAVFDALKGPYETTSTSDQPTTTIHHFLGAKRRSVSVYGALRVGERDGKDDRARAPAAFLRAFDALAAFRAPGAKPWLPEKIEVMLTEFSYAKDVAVEWPKTWPGLDDPATRRRGEDRSLFLESKFLPRLREIAAAMRPTQPVSLGGRLWSLAWRYPFPAEGAWMR